MTRQGDGSAGGFGAVCVRMRVCGPCGVCVSVRFMYFFAERVRQGWGLHERTRGMQYRGQTLETKQEKHLAAVKRKRCSHPGVAGPCESPPPLREVKVLVFFGGRRKDVLCVVFIECFGAWCVGREGVALEAVISTMAFARRCVSVVTVSGPSRLVHRVH